MAEWKVDTSRPAEIEHTATLARGTAKVVVEAVAGSAQFAVRVFILRPGAAEEEIPIEPDVYAEPTFAAEQGRRLAEKTLG